MTDPIQPAGQAAGYDPTVKDWGQGYDKDENILRHGLEESADGDATKASFASVGAGAWHNLGIVVSKQVKAEDLLKLANADYDVFLVPSIARLTRPQLDRSGQQVLDPFTDKPLTEVIEAEDPNKRHIVRFHPVTGEFQVLGTCSPRYQPISNRSHFIHFADALMDVAGPTVSTCGVLYDGRQAFMSWRLPKEVTVDGGDGAELWLLAHTSHDLSAPLTCAIVPIRPVCRNTIRVGLAQHVSKFVVKHTANAKLNIQQARTALKLSYSYADTWVDLMQTLERTPLNVLEFEKIIEANFGPGEDASKKAATVWEPKREKLVDLFVSAPTAAGSNAWGALNAIGEYCDWQTKAPAAGEFQTDSGQGGEDGFRFWRSLMDEKSVTRPKLAILPQLAEKAGYSTKLLAAKL